MCDDVGLSDGAGVGLHGEEVRMKVYERFKIEGETCRLGRGMGRRTNYLHLWTVTPRSGRGLHPPVIYGVVAGAVSILTYVKLVLRPR